MTLTFTHLVALSPLILVGATAVVAMLGIAWRRRHDVTTAISLGGQSLALVALLLTWPLVPTETPLMVVDGLAAFAGLLILIASLVCTALAYVHLHDDPAPEEFHLLLLCATAGGIALVASRHLATLFLGLELLSMPLYGMLAYARRGVSLEAGIKYLVPSAAASAFLLFGMALLYAQSGSLELAGLTAQAGGAPAAWGAVGAGMVLVGLAFKLSLVPFHLWTPDVYEGGPGAAALFLATVSKVAVFVALLRLVLTAPAFDEAWLHGVLAALALATMLVGNLLALSQSNLKRLLGYSSIAHLGYLLMVLVVADGLATETAGIYLVTYVVATLAAFGVVTLLSSPYAGEDVGELYHYRGLFWRRPYLTAALTLALLSLAGIPLTAGFIGKFYIVALGVQAERWWLVGGVVLGSAIGLYYYLKVMVMFYLPEPGMQQHDVPHHKGTRAGYTVVLALAALVVLLGVIPAPMIEWVRLMERVTLG